MEPQCRDIIYLYITVYQSQYRQSTAVFCPQDVVVDVSPIMEIIEMVKQILNVKTIPKIHSNSQHSNVLYAFTLDYPVSDKRVVSAITATDVNFTNCVEDTKGQFAAD